MTTGKQLLLYSVLLVSAYSSVSRCVEQQDSTDEKSVAQVPEQKLDFDALPLNVQEQIISYLPADNLYRALWSRSHNASQDFYDDTVKAYLESHFVPQELVDKTITQDFASFKGSEKQKQEFQDKIKKALEQVAQDDTQLLELYRKAVKIHDVYLLKRSLDMPLSKAYVLRMVNNKDALTRELLRIKENGELGSLKKELQNYYSYLAYCKLILSSEKNKTIIRDIVYTLDQWMNKNGIPLSGIAAELGAGAFIAGAIFYCIDKIIVDLSDSFYLYPAYAGSTLWAMLIPAYFVNYACNKLVPPNCYYNFVSIEKEIEYLTADNQAKTKQVLDCIEQVERA